MRKGIMASLTAILALPLLFIVTVHGQDTSLPFGIETSQLIFAGVFLGVVARMIYPYLAKAKAAAEAGGTATVAFNMGFVYVGIVNLVQSAIIATLVFQDVPALPGFFAAFGWAYASQDIASRIVT